MNTIPPVFLSHGSPMLLLEPGRSGPAWQTLAQTLPRPRAILAVSAPWPPRVPAISATPHPATIHDFHGFPDALYDMEYPAPGSAELAAQVAGLIPEIQIDARRGLDHGAWSPLRVMYPQADIPVIQLSVMPGADAATHFLLGRKLESLTRDGVLVLASGGLTHNLGDMVPDAPDGAALRHVAEFRDWFAAALARHDLPALMQWETLAPHARRAHPTPEHLLPLFVALGAAGEAARVDNFHRDYQLGALALDAFRFDPA